MVDPALIESFVVICGGLCECCDDIIQSFLVWMLCSLNSCRQCCSKIDGTVKTSGLTMTTNSVSLATLWISITSVS